MSQNPRGRPTKSAQHKKNVKKLLDQKRYLLSKSTSSSSSASTISVTHNEAFTSLSDEKVSSLPIYIKYFYRKTLTHYFV